MAFGRLERARLPRPMGEINMTPLIDVMLVLLVIFMITAPLMGSSLPLDLPKSDAAQPSDGTPYIALAINADGKLYLADEELAPDVLAQRLKERAHRQPDIDVQLRADSRVPYGQVAELIGMVQDAGLTRIGFVTQEPAPR
jgi:biopolymer transport protein ExbD/biopolymer transport protein TolR